MDSVADLEEDDAVSLMERSCRAAFLHHIKHIDRELQHGLCPSGPQSWCSYQADKYVSPNHKKDLTKDIKRLDQVSTIVFFECFKALLILHRFSLKS